MNKAKRTALLYHVCQAALASGIDKPFGFDRVPTSRVRRMVGAQFLTPRTHSNRNRDKQRRRRNLLKRLQRVAHARQHRSLEAALSD